MALDIVVPRLRTGTTIWVGYNLTDVMEILMT
jgi:hypothetical protein